MTEIKLPRPLNQKLSKSWFAQKIAEALGEASSVFRYDGELARVLVGLEGSGRIPPRECSTSRS